MTIVAMDEEVNPLTLEEQVVEALDRIHNDESEQWDEVHWISGAEDESCNYCYDCCKDTLAIMVSEKPELKDELHISSGNGGYDSDSSAFCTECQAPLFHSLTNYGAESTMEEFMDGQLQEEDGSISPVNAFALSKTIETIRYLAVSKLSQKNDGAMLNQFILMLNKLADIFNIARPEPVDARSRPRL